MKYGANTERLWADENPWGLRQRVSEADRDLVALHEMPESRCNFVLHEADGEWLMSHDCPEIGGERLKAKC
jgi:hypothetical protein